MTAERYDIVILGLSLSSSWGNGHATTYRALLRGLNALGKRVLFLERDVPWYATRRDLPRPDFCTLSLYSSVEELKQRFHTTIARAPDVIVGSYVPDGVAVIDWVVSQRDGHTHYYDIDTPVTLANLEEGEEEYISARQIPAFDTYFSFSGGALLDRLEKHYGARCAQALFCSVDADRYAPRDEPLTWDLGYLGTYSPDRQPTLETLLIAPARMLPDKRFVVAGPQYPDTIDWPSNIDRIDHLPPEDHPSFYARQRFTLNVTRRDMIAAGHSPSVRLFEAAACGVPVISDDWEGLREIFDVGEPALTIARGSEAVVKLLLADFERTRPARRLRNFACTRHTGRQRALELLEHLHQRQPDVRAAQ